MTNSLRTYRLLRVVLASVLLFSMAAPLVQYACAMTGTSLVAQPAPIKAGCGEPMGEIEQGLAGMLCPDEASCSSASQCHDDAQAEAHAETVEPCCCTSETVEGEKTTLVSESTLSAMVFLPLVAVLSADDAESSLRSPLFEEASPPGTASDGASLRVLHASFLL